MRNEFFQVFRNSKEGTAQNRRVFAFFCAVVAIVGVIILIHRVFATTGATWTQATAAAAWSTRESPMVTVFNNEMWVLGGENGSTKSDTWHSADGVTWTVG